MHDIATMVWTHDGFGAVTVADIQMRIMICTSM